MCNDIARLERYLMSRFGVVVDELIVEDSFPHIERPSVDEMEKAIEDSLSNIPLSFELESKLSRKPTWEMLTKFCEERGLTWEKDVENNAYIFRIKKFYSKK